MYEAVSGGISGEREAGVLREGTEKEVTGAVTRGG